MSETDQTQSLNVIGMHCASCASIIKRKLEKLPGVANCEVNFGTEKAKVMFDPQKVSVPQMNQEINKLGYALEASSQMPDMSNEQHAHMNHSTTDHSLHA